MKITLLFTIFFLVSCNSKDSNEQALEKPNSVDSLKAKLLGRWGGLGEDNPVWEIGIDSIYYYEEKKAYPYQIISGDMVIERTETKGILRNISVSEDTLTFTDEQGLTIKGYRLMRNN